MNTTFSETPDINKRKAAVAAFERFLETIQTLRAPGGCPWDRDQTPLSMRRDLIEETFEAIDDYLKSIPKDAEIKREEFMVPLILSGSNLHQFGRISRTGLRWIMNEALKRAGMKRKGQSCHILRHSCATNLYADTKDLKKVQAALRHKSSNITARYAKTYDSMNK